MEYQQYITDRFDPQRKYYSENSTKYQRNYKVIRIIQIILAASLPFAIAYITADTVWLKIGTGLIGVAIAVLQGIQTLYKWQEKGIEYRKASESMKHEKWLFQAQSGVYDQNATPLRTFVERVEGIIGEENKSWVAFNNVNVVNKETPSKPPVEEEETPPK